MQSLKAAGKEQTNAEKTWQLKESIKHVNHPQLQLIIGPAIGRKMTAANYPLFDDLVEQLVNLEHTDQPQRKSAQPRQKGQAQERQPGRWR